MNSKFEDLVLCTRCIYSSQVGGISFDEEGVCNYCRQIENLQKIYGTGQPEGEKKLLEIIEEVKSHSRNKKYDCVIGVSGGTDSSFMLYKTKEWGLRPLAVHYDNTWNTAISTENIRKVTTALNIDLYTYVVDNKEADDLFRAFFLAGVPELDSSTDLGYAQVLRMAAAKNNVKYVFEGHSFMAEGISPPNKNYFDGKYIKDIHNKFGQRPMKTYPLMTFYQFMKWSLIKKIQFIRPLWYTHYTKEDAKKFLAENYGWKYYGGHHLENRSSAFLHNYYNPVKFHLDNRNLSLAASVRSGVMSREEAIREYYFTPLEYNEELVEYFIKRTGLTREEFDRGMKEEPKFFTSYKTYKKRFERLRPLFKILADKKLVPMSFYLKYCFPLNK
jgi:N-acetyl sugar amidotransferase